MGEFPSSVAIWKRPGSGFLLRLSCERRKAKTCGPPSSSVNLGQHKQPPSHIKGRRGKLLFLQKAVVVSAPVFGHWQLGRPRLHMVKQLLPKKESCSLSAKKKREDEDALRLHSSLIDQARGKVAQRAGVI